MAISLTVIYSKHNWTVIVKNFYQNSNHSSIIVSTIIQITKTVYTLGLEILLIKAKIMAHQIRKSFLRLSQVTAMRYNCKQEGYGRHL